MNAHRICFVSPRVYLYFQNGTTIPPGGAERQLYYIGLELSKEKLLDVNYCVANYGQINIEKYNYITIWKAFSINKNKVKNFLILFKVLRKINADIYIFRSADIGVFVATFALKYILRRKILYMVANSKESISTDELKRAVGWLSAKCMGFTYKFVDILTVQSQEQADAFLSNRKRKVDGIIRNIYKVKIKESEIDIPLKDTIVWVGRCHKIKQPEIFIELAKRYDNEKFVMICPKATGAENYFTEIKNEAQKAENLQFIDFVEPDKIYKYYLNAKIYVITSESEGFPNTMMEAMEAKCPVLSLNINPDNILHEHNIGLCTNELDVFYKNFYKLNAHPELRKTMGCNARKYLEEFHNEDNIIQKFKKLLLKK